jgi:hypothetical protein
MILPSKQEARINRDKDSGIAYALAHIIVIVGLYYAYTRRTLTPLVFIVIANTVSAFVVALALFMSSGNLKSFNRLATIAGFILTPFAAKQGINSARDEKGFGLELKI